MNGISGILLRTLLGLLGGIGVTSLALWFAVRRDNRQRKERNERPPETSKLLRPPGFGLQQRLDQLGDEQHEAIFQLLLPTVILGILVSGLIPVFVALVQAPAAVAQLLTTPISLSLLLLVCAIIGSAFWLWNRLRRVMQLRKLIRCSRLGMRGEQAVAESLYDHSVVAAGYRAFHDVPGDGAWNIDHVVVGPGGVFVIETKTRSRRKSTNGQPEHVAVFDGQNLRFPWGNDFRAAEQVQRNAEWVRRFIASSCHKDAAVQPIIVIPGWFVQTLADDYPVQVMNAKYLRGFLTRRPEVLNKQQFKSIQELFEQRCRDVEF